MFGNSFIVLVIIINSSFVLFKVFKHSVIEFILVGHLVLLIYFNFKFIQ
jgi:hypothetical protein